LTLYQDYGHDDRVPDPGDGRSQEGFHGTRVAKKAQAFALLGAGRTDAALTAAQEYNGLVPLDVEGYQLALAALGRGGRQGRARRRVTSRGSVQSRRVTPCSP
jgi:hypothetical protein